MNSIVTQLLSFPPSYPVQYVDYDKLAKGNFKLLSNTGAAKLRDGVGGTNLFDVAYFGRYPTRHTDLLRCSTPP